MDSAVVAAFVVAGFAVVTSFANIIVSLKTIRKDSIIRVVVETRVNYLHTLRGANATFVGIANPDVILKYALTDNGMFVYPKELAEASGMLVTLFKPFYPIENRMIELITSIKGKCLFLCADENEGELIDTIKDELAIYSKLFAQYDWAYWHYIMKQADGRYRNSNIDFDEVYEELRDVYARNYNYVWQ